MESAPSKKGKKKRTKKKTEILLCCSFSRAFRVAMKFALGCLSFLAPLTGTDALGLFGNATAVVHGRAQHFIAHDGLAGAKITCEEFPELTATTDENGLFQLDAPVGANLTLTLTHEATRTTTAATFTVPPEGIPQGAETEVPFQAPLKVCSPQQHGAS